jgi:hypothetical protein
MTETSLVQTQRPAFDLSPQTFEQALTFSNYLADSDMVPKDFKGKPGNCLIAMQWGAEIGLKPLQALQGIAVINGRPSLWGDALLAIVRASPLCEYVQEGWEQDGTAYCKAKRRGEPEQVRTFSDFDAKLAGLLGKQGPWTTGPKRMKQLRARAFALRDVFTDVLKGMPMAEELQDYSLQQEAKTIDPATGEIAQKSSAMTAYSDEDFAKNLPAWRKLIESGKKTAGEIIFTVSSKATLTEDQTAMVMATVVPTPIDAE